MTTHITVLCERLEILISRMAAGTPIWIDIVIGLVMAFVSATVAIWYQARNRPRFVITAGTTTDGDRGQPGNRVRFTHVRVENVPRRFRLVKRKTAYACHGRIDFLDAGGTPIVHGMPIRWNGAPQPLKPEGREGVHRFLYDPRLLRAGGYIDIAPDQAATISPALRLHGDPIAFGWTTESYAHNWRHPLYQLPFGQYVVRITVQTEDYGKTAEFTLSNPEDYEGFQLLEEGSALPN